LRLFSFGGYGLALAALALMFFALMTASQDFQDTVNSLAEARISHMAQLGKRQTHSFYNTKEYLDDEKSVLERERLALVSRGNGEIMHASFQNKYRAKTGNFLADSASHAGPELKVGYPRETGLRDTRATVPTPDKHFRLIHNFG